jgi:RHS repeat-associated protein
MLNGLYAGSTPYYEDKGITLHGYTNQSFPTKNADNSALEILSVNYYDNYDFDFDGTDDFSYVSQGISGEGTQGNSFSLPTGSKRIVLGTTSWLRNYLFYDRFGRPIQSRSNNHLSATVDNLATTVYDFEGKRLVTKVYHNSGGTNQTTVINKFNYDAAGRLLTVFQNNNGAPSDQLVAQYAFNELGQMVDKKLHDNGGGNFIQSVDYRYNILGWLQSINNAQLSNDNGATNDDNNDYFGLELLYNTVDPGLNNLPNYNGNVSAVKWKSYGAAGVADERSYSFTYDKTDKLLSSVFQANNGSTWTKESGTLNEMISYDANGNILTIQRNQNLRGITGTTITSTSQTVDNLTYTYSTGNQLSQVEDAVGTTIGLGDFKNVASQANEYTYDSIGNSLSDLNKGINSITYNVLGKAQQINFADGRSIVYSYDAAERKLKMATTISGTTTTTDYVNGFVYTNNALNFFSSPEGRVAKNTAGNLEYQYAISDNQGNTRVLFTSAPQSAVTTTATFEGDANDQQSQFLSVNQSNVIPSTAGNNTPGGNRVVRLNQTYPVGPSWNKKLCAGDKVDMEVYAYYEPTSGYGSTNTLIASMITSVATAFGGVANAPDFTGQIYNGVSSAINNFGLGSNPGDAQPSAYLNYILFDRNYKVMDMGWTAVPSTANFAKQKISLPTITAKEAGFIFIYLSYEDQSNNWVYFDDLKVTFTPTNILQSNEYYPFGLQTANSWTRDNSNNNFLYNGGSELNTTTGLYDLRYRNYDAVLGRFGQVDPLADTYSSLSPYNYGNNNPARFNDPSGAGPGDKFDNRGNFLGFGGPASPWSPIRTGGFSKSPLRTADDGVGGSAPMAGTFSDGLDWISEGSGSTPVYDGNGGYYMDTNGNGIKDEEEQNLTFDQVRQFFGNDMVSTVYITWGKISGYANDDEYGVANAREIVDLGAENQNEEYVARARRALDAYALKGLPSTIYSIDWGLMSGWNFMGIKAELVLFAVQGWTNDPREKSDEKVKLYHQATIGLKNRVEIELAMEQKIKSEGDHYSDPNDFFKTAKLNFASIELGGKYGINGVVENTPVQSSWSIDLIFVRITADTLIDP